MYFNLSLESLRFMFFQLNFDFLQLNTQLLQLNYQIFQLPPPEGSKLLFEP